MTAAAVTDRWERASALISARAVTILRVTLDGTVCVSPATHFRSSDMRPFREVSEVRDSIIIARDLCTSRPEFWRYAETAAARIGWLRASPWLLYARMPACVVRPVFTQAPTGSTGRETQKGN